MVRTKPCSSKRIQSVAVYKPKFSSQEGRKIKAFHLIFLGLYVYLGSWCIRTIGEPYRTFLLKADREGFQVMEGSQKMRAELEYALADINDVNRKAEKLGWFDWMNLDIEEAAELKKKEKMQNVLDSLPKHMRVPNKYSADFVPMLLLGISVVLHVFIILMQFWSVQFNVSLNYTPIDMDQIDIPDEIMEIPHDMEQKWQEQLAGGSKRTLGEMIHDEAEKKAIPGHLPTHVVILVENKKHILVPLVYVPTLGLTFEFHRRRYTYVESTQTWTKIRCKVNMPTSFFHQWEGFTQTTQITASEIRYGKNEFSVKQPGFMDMYKAQLLSPFTVFQLFCVILWMLDDYWQYSFFSLFMILVFEATVVFSRLKSLGALKGMGNPSRTVWVFRMGSWTQIDTTDLLPGDVMSLTRHAPHVKKDDKTVIDNGGDIVPADLLLLKGSAVVNEASLTGESVPQVKDGLSELTEESLSMKNSHKTHVLYAGTKMLQCKGVDVIEEEEESSEEEGDGLLRHAPLVKSYSSIPKSPDGGALCFVLRTGFLSAQGKLVRMIEGSQEKVKGHERETGLLLLLLFFFALASASYVLYHCYGKENRSNYELLLHCIMIITSVIPPELNMQMALAVNNSLMTLMKMQVFCTEPFRVPIAGKLDVCLFDKTGTLTTDELAAVGVCKANSISKDSKVSDSITPMTKVDDEAALILAGCHSLVLIDGRVTGDPLESAALKSMRWSIDEATGNSVPSKGTEKREGGKPIQVHGHVIRSVEVLARHHFSSKLQRMSCVIRDVHNRTIYSVVKGSPEAIGALLEKVPCGFHETAKALAKNGYRVIALAYKVLNTSDQIERAKEVRLECERNIISAGFIAFTCRIRKDTEMILARLTAGGMSIAMITGDALLTAAHVAKEVGICDKETNEEVIDMQGIPYERDDELRTLLEDRRRQKMKALPKIKKERKPILILETSQSGELYWQSYDDESFVSSFKASDIPTISSKYDFAVTGKTLTIAFQYHEEIKSYLGYFKIFARMTPDAKETVIECLHSVGSLCLMCGDGANDVGALKRADVGVALLSGFGDVNVDKGEDGKKKSTEVNDDSDLPRAAFITEDQIQAMRMVPLYLVKTKIRQLGINPDIYKDITDKEDFITIFRIKLKEKARIELQRKKALINQKNDKGNLLQEKQMKMAKRVEELQAQGVQYPQWQAMKEFMAEEKAEAKKRNVNRGVEGQAASLTAQFEDLELDEIPMVKLGDASIAAPFTSKMPSIRSCVDIVRQGRCTLVTSMQMYQILALNCMISSYSLSVLYLDGVKYGDTQMTAMGMLMTVSFTTVSRSKPLDELSSVKPLTSIFHPSAFISMLAQFGVHFSIMMLAVRAAKMHLPPDYDADLDGEFRPGILNSVVFLVSNVQQVTVFVVNLQGRPFMTGLTENRPLLWSLLATFILTFMFASESVPHLNKYFQLVPFPDESFRNYILGLLMANVCSTFLVDRLLKFIFARDILYASLKGTTMKDIFGLLKTVFVLLSIMWMFIGNEQVWDELTAEMNAPTNSSELVNVSEAMNDSIPTMVDVVLQDEF